MIIIWNFITWHNYTYFWINLSFVGPLEMCWVSSSYVLCRTLFHSHWSILLLVRGGQQKNEAHSSVGSPPLERISKLDLFNKCWFFFPVICFWSFWDSGQLSFVSTDYSSTLCSCTPFFFNSLNLPSFIIYHNYPYWLAGSAGVGFTPHVINVKAGEVCNFFFFYTCIVCLYVCLCAAVVVVCLVLII